MGLLGRGTVELCLGGGTFLQGGSGHLLGARRPDQFERVGMGPGAVGPSRIGDLWEVVSNLPAARLWSLRGLLQ